LYGIQQFTLSIFWVDSNPHVRRFPSVFQSRHVRNSLIPQQFAWRQSVLKKSGSYLLLFIFIGGLLGSILAEILQIVAPEGMVQSIFGQALNLGLDPPVTVNLVLMKFTLGFLLKMNLLTILGMLLGAYVYKHV
jgi:hypothetical protein